MIIDQTTSQEPAQEEPVSSDGPVPAKRAASYHRWVWSILGVLALVFAVAAVLSAWAFWQYQTLAEEIKPTPEIQKQVSKELSAASTATPESAKLPLQYVLIMGTDLRPGEASGRSDSLIMARVDPAVPQVDLMSIHRDMRVPIDGHGTTKINAALSYGGPALAIGTVKQFTGLPIQHYIQIDFPGLAKVVDAMGGISIDVDEDIRNNDTAALEIAKGYQKLNGARALQYVRSRRSAGDDITRMRHHQAFLTALAEQALSPSQIGRLAQVAQAVAGNIETDMSVAQLLDLAVSLRGIKRDDIHSYTVPSTGLKSAGVWYAIPDLEAARRMFRDFEAGRASAVGD